MDSKLELQLAIEAGDLEEFRRLFEPDDLYCDYYFGSLLNAVATFGTMEIAKFAVDAGADVNRPDERDGVRAVKYAALKGKVDMVRFLVEAGAELEVIRPHRNPLLDAARHGHLETVEYLLLETDIDRHATYRKPTGKLYNALTEAEGRQHTEVAELLKANGCRQPVEGVDIPLWEPRPEFMVNQSPEFQRSREIIEYMERQFGPADENGMQELLPPVEGMSVGINVIRPNDFHPHLVIFTNGMSERPMNVPAGQEDWGYAELVMHLPIDWMHPQDAKVAEDGLQWMWPIQWLRKAAYIPHLNEEWLGRPATIISSNDPPEPLGPNTAQSCLLLLPDLQGLQEPLRRSDGKRIHFYTAVPLYTEERDYEREHGVKPFLKAFSKHKVPLTLEIDRPNFG